MTRRHNSPPHARAPKGTRQPQPHTAGGTEHPRTPRTAASLLAMFGAIIAAALLISTCRPADDTQQADGDQPAGARRGGGDATQQELSEEQIRAVEAQLIGRETFFGAIEASGVVRGIQEATVVSETNGAIQEVRVRLGQAVSRGRVLVTLDDSLERHAVEQASDQLAVAEIEFAATQRLYENGNSSPAALARAQASVSGTRSALAQARRQLANRIITAPFDGNIAVLPQAISTGNFIQIGTPIVTIVNMSRAQVNVGLGEREIQMVRVGDSARMYIDACGPDPQEATVRGIAAGSDSQSGNFIVNIEFVNRCGAQLKSGMASRIEIANSTDEPTIIIPSNTLIRDGDDQQYFVFIARPDGAGYFAERRPVEIIRILGDRAEVGTGLAENEILITAPIREIEDGAEIHPTTIRG